jgi:hypothetical protein
MREGKQSPSQFRSQVDMHLKQCLQLLLPVAVAEANGGIGAMTSLLRMDWKKDPLLACPLFRKVCVHAWASQNPASNIYTRAVPGFSFRVSLFVRLSSVNLWSPWARVRAIGSELIPAQNRNMSRGLPTWIWKMCGRTDCAPRNTNQIRSQGSSPLNVKNTQWRDSYLDL